MKGKGSASKAGQAASQKALRKDVGAAVNEALKLQVLFSLLLHIAIITLLLVILSWLFWSHPQEPASNFNLLPIHQVRRLETKVQISEWELLLLETPTAKSALYECG